jgi:hypothetical protein
VKLPRLRRNSPLLMRLEEIVRDDEGNVIAMRPREHGLGSEGGCGEPVQPRPNTSPLQVRQGEEGLI